MDDASQIISLVNMYAVAVDSRRYHLFEHIFTLDIACDFGGGAGFSDRGTFISAFEQIHAAFSATQHMTSGHVISIERDEAHCFSYVDGRFRRQLDDHEGLFSSTGWYDDLLVRTLQGWRIKHRVSRMVSYSGDISVMQAMPGVDTNYVLSSLHVEADGDRVRFLRHAAISADHQQ